MASKLERRAEFAIVAACKAAGLPLPVKEFPFAKEAMGRAWRFDFCWGEPYWLAVEIDGGTWTKGKDGQVGGAHNRGAKYVEGLHKGAAAAALGWRVIHADGSMVRGGLLVPYVLAALRRDPRPSIQGPKPYLPLALKVAAKKKAKKSRGKS